MKKKRLGWFWGQICEKYGISNGLVYVVWAHPVLKTPAVFRAGNQVQILGPESGTLVMFSFVFIYITGNRMTGIRAQKTSRFLCQCSVSGELFWCEMVLVYGSCLTR